MKRKTKKRLNGMNNTISNIFTLISLSYIGKIILYGVFTAVVILITAAVFKDDFDKFFTALGVEVLIATVIGWAVYLAFKKNQ